MNRLKNIRGRTGSPWRLGALAAVISAVVLVGVAQAAPSTKNYDAAVTPASADGLTFTLTLKNDRSSQQTLGSANFTAPAGLTLNNDAATTKAGWHACVGDGMICGAGANNIVMLRSDKGAELAKDTFVQATVSATKSTSTACTSADWTIGVKQSNDFSGSGNDFAPKLVDATPLGSIGLATTNIDSMGGSQYVSLQNAGGLFTLTATAYDTCGNVKAGYNGASLFSPPTLYTGSFTKIGLDGVTLSALSWSGGTASTSITPLVAQTGNDVTVADTVSGISASTGLFDVVDHVCDPGAACSWQDKQTNPATTVTSQGVNGFLGVGFKSAKAVSFTCGTKSAAIGSIVEISPSQVFGDATYTVSIVYSRQASGTGPAASFLVCLSKDNGATWGDLNPEGDQTPLQACSDTVPAPCVLSQKRITGGALEVDLSLTPVDPWPGIG